MPRILSDLHLFDASTRIASLDALAPLLADVDELVLNGDTTDTQDDPDSPRLAHLRAALPTLGPRITLLTGNHDPDISDRHELLLCADRVWVTHGDILFPDLTPWSSVQPTLASRLAAIRQRLGETAWADLNSRLPAYREACLRLPHEFDRTSRSLPDQLRRVIKTFLPPSQFISILRSWRAAARLARELAARHRPTAQVIINGHIHYPFVSRLPGRPTVINTGSFSRPLGPRLVDVHPEHVVVRRVVERDRRFHPGRIVAEIPLAPSPASP